MKPNYLEYKRKKRSRKRRASQGMTAAIILIAFIITAAGIAFVILTMGAEMQLELGEVGDDGKDAASSALQVEGNVITGQADSSSNIVGYAFNLKLVLGSGQIDLSDSATTFWLSVNHGEETELTLNTSLTSLALTDFTAASGDYNLVWEQGSSDVIDPGELVRVYIGSKSTTAAADTDVMIVINTRAATLKIEKTIPVGIVASGVNLL